MKCRKNVHGMIEEIKQKTRELYPRLLTIRRHLHQYPELSFQEKNTALYIQKLLDENGIPFVAGVGGTGIVATIIGEKEEYEKTIALRADMDALPIDEQNEVSYKSKHPGIMHACGHDVHMTSLLGALFTLNELRSKFAGKVRCIFQPGEELSPGGASLMIKEGVLENPEPIGIIGQHVYPTLKAGQVGFRSGMMMASSDELEIHIRGKGGHGAVPHQAVDPILIASHVITACQQIVSRIGNPAIPTVLNIGSIQSVGGTYNVIPDEVHLKGTFRTFDENWRKEGLKRIKKLIEGMARSMGGDAEITIRKGYPFLVNEEGLTEKCRKYAQEFLGIENVKELPMRLTSEDFAFYTHIIPGCFYRLGTDNEEGDYSHQVHSGQFNIDEEALQTGAGLMAWLAICSLKDQ